MVTALDHGLSGLGLSSVWGQCLVFWARHVTLPLPRALHPDVQMGTGKLKYLGLPCVGLASHSGWAEGGWGVE